MTIPTLPDDFSKFLLIAGIVLAVYSSNDFEKSLQAYNDKVDKYNELLIESNIQLQRLEFEMNSILKVSEFLSGKYNIENPLVKEDSVVVFSQTVPATKNQEFVTDSISKLWTLHKEKSFNSKLERNKLNFYNSQIQLASQNLDSTVKNNNFTLLTSAIMVLIGLFGWYKNQKNKNQLIKIELREKGGIYTHCQSCGKNFSSINDYGTMDNGSKNYAFCSTCYSNGEFNDDLTYDDFLKLKEKIISEQKGWIKKIRIAMKFDNLERWNKNEY